MKYLNKRTGNVIIVPCRLEGPDWEEITDAEKSEPKEETPAKAAPKKRTAKKG
jgi:hypothetical protein